MTASYDVIIVGAGAMGSSAARALAAAGRDVLVLEQFELGHDRGGSHGATRIFRLGTEEQEYLDLTEQSRRLWRELEDESGETLREQIGAVEHGVSSREVELFVALLGERRVDHEVLSPEEATERWPGMLFDGPVLYQPGGARIYADRTVAALRRLAIRDGATFLERRAVEAIRLRAPDGPGAVEVVAEETVFRAQQVIVTAGPWTPSVLRGLLVLPAIVATQEQPRHFVALTDTQAWPCFVQWRHDPGPHGRYESYGLPEPGVGVKVGLHGSGPAVDPDARDFEQDPDVERALLDYVKTWFPGLDPERSTSNSCLYDNPATNRFIIDRVGPVIVAAGFHGQGFKFVPVMGELLRDISIGAAAAPDFFSLKAHLVLAAAGGAPSVF